MKIGMLTQWFDPETGPAALPGVYAREFVKQGHSVKVLTGFPNYPEGKLYPGHRMRVRSVEHAREVRVTRVPLYPNHSRSSIGRLVNYASFGAAASVLGSGALRGSEALWVYNSPITVALPMLTHSRFGRTPVFLHVQDLWPDSLMESGMFPGGRVGRQAERVVSSVVRLMERRAAVVGVISKSVRELILERHPRLDPERIVYVPNPANEQLFRPVGTRRPTEVRATGALEVMYAGAIGEVQGLSTLLEAAELLRGRDDIRFTMVGDGISRQQLERRASESGLTNVTFVGRVAQEEIPALIARADVQLVSLASNPFLAYTTPSKIPSLLASGVPIVAQLDGDGATMLRESGAAWVVPPGRAKELAEAIGSLAALSSSERAGMGEAGRCFYENHLSARAAAGSIVDALKMLA